MFRNNDASVAAGWLVVALLLAAGCGQSEQPPRSGEAPSVTAVQLALHLAMIEVKTSQVPVTVEVTGQVTAVYQATLASRIQGTIDNLLVREGSAVRKGQTLLVLDNRDSFQKKKTYAQIQSIGTFRNNHFRNPFQGV